ncbi:MAG: ImmA/IrrE family metallo-endopeptidase, partial [Halanaerobiales bacterium]|nr:ImmA/IrrE family metallo-endopeptidase [Halanaerobiales bacterium]
FNTSSQFGTTFMCIFKLKEKIKTVKNLMGFSTNLLIRLNSYQQRYILAHEYYHFLDVKGEDKYFDGIFIDDANDNLNERKADYFATLLLLDENQVRHRFENLKKLEYSFEEIVCKLMNVFKVPYKMMSIRLLEIGLIKDSDLISNRMLDYNKTEKLFDELGLDKFILVRTTTIKFGNIKIYLKLAEKEMLEEDYNNALKYYENISNRLNNTNTDLFIHEFEKTIKKFSDDFNPDQQEKIEKIRECLEDLKRGNS